MKIDITEDALNLAAWKLHDEILHVDGDISNRLFNKLKTCLKAAIETYLTEKEKEA